MRCPPDVGALEAPETDAFDRGGGARPASGRCQRRSRASRVVTAEPTRGVERCQQTRPCERGNAVPLARSASCGDPYLEVFRVSSGDQTTTRGPRCRLAALLAALAW